MGKGIAIIIVLTVFAASWTASHPITKKDATLTYWVFARTHYQAYQKSVKEFEESHPGVTVDMQLVHHEAITSRLQSAFWADLEVPDLVELAIDNAGQMFRGPIEQVGFIDLKPWLISIGYYDRIVLERFAPYSSQDRILGMPHDVHPVMLAYRKDIFEKEGIDIRKFQTWEDFIQTARFLTRPNERYMLELSDNNSAHYEMFLFQKGGGYFDKDGKLTMDDAIALDTLLWYIPLVAGPDRIGTALGAAIGMGHLFTQAVENDYILCFLCPDWRTKFIETDAPRMAGKMALMPLPVFDEGGRQTTTCGGTMLGITRKSKNQSLALEFAESLYLDTERLAASFEDLNILPAFKDAWKQEAFHESRPFWSDQRIGELYADIASEVPSQYTSPFLSKAKIEMGFVISSCAAYYSQYGANDFKRFAEERLKMAAEEVRRAMLRNPFIGESK